MQFQKATKSQSKLRLALIGPAGSGKTYSALEIASHLGSRIALIDTEHGSASKYADLFQFDTCTLESFHPQQFINGIQAAGDYDVLVIDSLSHAWMGKEGALELVEQAKKRNGSSNSFSAWRDVTPLHNQLVDAMLAYRAHLIVTMRSKTEYIVEKDDKGKAVPRKVGLAPIQRDGLEYEFDVVGDLDQENTLIVSKSRCPKLSRAVISQPGQQVAEALKQWLGSGTPTTSKPVEVSSNGQAETSNGFKEVVGVASPEDLNPAWLKFLDVLSRADTGEKLDQAEEWLRKPNQWKKVQDISDIETKIHTEIGKVQMKMGVLF